MFLCQPLVEVLAKRNIQDIDSFLKTASLNDLPSPLSIMSMKEAVERVFRAIRDRERITIFGDYDCDGVLSAKILGGVLEGFGTSPRIYLPHRDEGYGLRSPAVHRFSQSGTDLLITVDNGVNARSVVHLAQRLGIDVIVIDHHRIHEKANALVVWSPDFCGAGLAVMFCWALALRSDWKDARIERLVLGCSRYAAIASIADCVPLLGATRVLARLGLAQLPHTRDLGLQELLKVSCSDPTRPDSLDIAFGVAPRINAAGRMDHPGVALSVFEPRQTHETARQRVETLNRLNVERRRVVDLEFEKLIASVVEPVPAALVIYRESCPKGIAGLLASKCVERFAVPSIVLVPSATPGEAVGSGRSIAGLDLVENLKLCERFLTRFGGHAQAAGLAMPFDRIQAFEREFVLCVHKLDLQRCTRFRQEAELALSTMGKTFDEQLALLEPFGEGNPAPILLVRSAEVAKSKNKWAKIRQGRRSIEVRAWDVPVAEGMKGDFSIEFHGKTRILRGFEPERH